MHGVSLSVLADPSNTTGNFVVPRLFKLRHYEARNVSELGHRYFLGRFDNSCLYLILDHTVVVSQLTIN